MFNPAIAVLVAADTISQLRRCDVYRVLSQHSGAERRAVAAYICQHRRCLSAEVAECLDDLADEETADLGLFV